MRFVKVCLAVIVSCGACPGLDPGRQISQYTVRSWTQAQGLPQDSVRALAQTPDGHLWVGTDEGLARFDGYAFTSVPPNDLPSTAIRALCSASDGTLWIGTASGLATHRHGKVSNISALDSMSISGIAEGPDKAIWIAAGTRLFRYSDGSFTNYGPENGLRLEGVRALLPVGPNDVIVAGYGAVGRFRNGNTEEVSSTREMQGGVPTALLREATGTLLTGGTKGLFARSAAGHWKRLPNLGVFVRALSHDKDGNLWIGTNSGLVRMRSGSTALDYSARFAGDWIWSIFEDREGTLWVGTNKGLYQMIDQPIAVYGREEGLPSDEPAGVAQDAAERIWTGFHSGGLGYIEYTRFVRTPGFPATEVLSVRSTNNGDILAGTRTGVYRISNRRIAWHYRPLDALGRSNVFDAVEDPSGDLWLGTNGGLLRIHAGRASIAAPGATLLDDAVVTVLAARDGSMWAGTYASGLWHVKGGERTRYTRAAGLPSDQIRALHEDESGTIWIATFGGGLAFFRSGHFGVASASDRLPSQNVGAIVGDGGFLWLATTRGIVKVSRESLAGSRQPIAPAIFFGVGEGLRSSNAAPGYPTASGGIRAHDGSVWFPTARGLARFNPVLPQVPGPLFVGVSEISVDGKPWDATTQLRLPANSSRVEFRYSAIHLSAPESLRYRFRLEPDDRDWIDARNRRTASYSNLSRGDHRFLVSAALGGSNEWHEAEPIVFNKEPQFYETLWFLALATAGIATLAWAAWSYRLRQERRRFAVVLEERSRIARELHDTLAQGYVGIASQLGAVGGLLRTQPEAAAQQVDLARRMAQYSLTEARRSIADLRSASLESSDLPGAIRTAAGQLTEGSGINIRYEFPADLRALPNATAHQLLRIVQEAVANSVKHGAAANIAIQLSNYEKGLLLAVRDDGRGFDAAADGGGIAGHFGLIGMRERAESLGGTLSIASSPDRGTTIEVQVPI